MNLPDCIGKMIRLSGGNRRDVNHFMKVYAYAKTIGELEGLPPETQRALEAAAVLHDVACPLCREKYGNANGKAQEREGGPMAARFLEELGCERALVDRVAFLVAHHHTYEGVDGPDYQILLEADFLVNADEKPLPPEAVAAARERFFRTGAGRDLLAAMYPEAV